MPAIPEPVFLKPRVDEFLAYCDGGMKQRSVRRKLAAVKSFCKWLEGEGLLAASLIDSIAGPPRPREELPDVPSEDDVKKLLDGDIQSASPERDRVILELLYASGLRAAELVGINLDDFTDEDVLVVRGKGRKERFVIVGGYAQAAIKAWLPVRAELLAKFKVETSALLFSVGAHRSAERLDVRSVGRILKAVAEAKGLDPAKWHPHLLRHACGTHMHDHDAPLQGVATFLGHARLSTAQIYTRVSVGRMMQTYNKAHPHAAGQGVKNVRDVLARGDDNVSGARPKGNSGSLSLTAKIHLCCPLQTSYSNTHIKNKIKTKLPTEAGRD